MAKEGLVFTLFTNLINSHGDSSNLGNVLTNLKASKLDCPFSWGAAGQKYGPDRY
jgi:hypothetical protein